MFQITRFTCEEQTEYIVTDERQPHFSFAVESDRAGASLAKAVLEVYLCEEVPAAAGKAPARKETAPAATGKAPARKETAPAATGKAPALKETAPAASAADNVSTAGAPAVERPARETFLWRTETTSQIGIAYDGPELKPLSRYHVYLAAIDDQGSSAEADLQFATGRLDLPWEAKWITDRYYEFTEKKVSPLPMTFRKTLDVSGDVRRAEIYATALGIYQVTLDGDPVDDTYFAPGFTSYAHTLQYQVMDVTDRIRAGAKELLVTVAGGWAVGSFVFTRKNRISADRQALLLELHMTYEDGRREVIGTDSSWMVSLDGPVRMADLYDGETYDARRRISTMTWRLAEPETLRRMPRIVAQRGPQVREHERMSATFLHHVGDEDIYDLGQNFAGFVELWIDGHDGEEITIRHAELLKEDGSLNTDFLRSAKATVTYLCREGEQTYTPHFTYMGFRYIGVRGAAKERIRLTGVALYSDLRQTGTFRCSNEMLNRLQQNIVWGAKSNFVEIPTDCPQRDERMGWTGDIAVFAPTAVYNFDMSSFLSRWLRDMRAEQRRTGGIPNTIPSQGYGFPATMPVMAVDFWGDASVLVPWALYRASGDIRVLRTNYEMMKRYVDACRRWAALFSFGRHRYLWHTPSVLHFGDWVAADVPRMSQWQRRSKWTATASLAHTSGLLSQIASILGEADDAACYRKIADRTADAYAKLLMHEDGTLKEAFQTGYVLPIYFGLLQGKQLQGAADALAQMVEANGYRIGTGFPGTPYILFALADHGHAECAYRMLMNTDCPSWLYEVRMGATTIWERWDGLDEDGKCPIGDDGTDMMISYNHYASGAVGDFLYRRVLGLEAEEAGYRTFLFRPLIGGGLTQAEGSVETPYGTITACWQIEGDTLTADLHVPVGAEATVELPGAQAQRVGSGAHHFMVHKE